jgi:hypothetical protein
LDASNKGQIAMNGPERIDDLLAILQAVPDGRARYQALAEQRQASIASGELPSGTRLPAERELSRALGVSRTTVVGAVRHPAP